VAVNGNGRLNGHDETAELVPSEFAERVLEERQAEAKAAR
jgi:hypothetical protein